jgi:hypothetical protein
MRYSLLYRGKSISLGSTNAVIGRSDACRVVLEGSDVSRRHARLRVSGEQLMLEDLSENGVLLNGERITKAEVLRSGDRLEIGHHVLAVQIDVAVPTTDEGAPASSDDLGNFDDGARTEYHGGFELLEATAKEMLQRGERQLVVTTLAPKLQAALMGARASGKIAPSMCRQASRVALWLAHHRVEGYWPDYVLDLHMVVGQALSALLAEQLDAAVSEHAAPIDRDRLRAYIYQLQRKADTLTDDERRALAHLERLSSRL